MHQVLLSLLQLLLIDVHVRSRLLLGALEANAGLQDGVTLDLLILNLLLQLVPVLFVWHSFSALKRADEAEAYGVCLLCDFPLFEVQQIEHVCPRLIASEQPQTLLRVTSLDFLHDGAVDLISLRAFTLEVALRDGEATRHRRDLCR